MLSLLYFFESHHGCKMEVSTPELGFPVNRAVLMILYALSAWVLSVYPSWKQQGNHVRFVIGFDIRKAKFVDYREGYILEEFGYDLSCLISRKLESSFNKQFRRLTRV